MTRLRTYVIASVIFVVVAISTPSAFAVSTCDTMPNKAQSKNCWMEMIGNATEIADDYNAATLASRNVPDKVKQEVHTEFLSIEGNIHLQCKNTDYTCTISIYEHFYGFAYHETTKYGVPDKRLN
ncbi:hypothetical protein [Burkholderia sp. 22PA0106]|uniref:hypothetical protein n=1 Tax=Burkholderia sp. 22PA0106 TaxID=3237371 RepID=UPI0039C0A929